MDDHGSRSRWVFRLDPLITQYLGYSAAALLPVQPQFHQSIPEGRELQAEQFGRPGFVPSGLLEGLLGAITGRERDHPRDRDPKVPHVAVKCDLCAGYDDYACVTACPVGAAFRIAWLIMPTPC